MTNYYYNSPYSTMFPTGHPGNLNYPSHLPANQSFLQALHTQQLQQYQAAASRDNQQQQQQLPTNANVQRQQVQNPSTTANQSAVQQMAYLTAYQQQLSQQEQNKALAQQLSLPHIQALLNSADTSRLHPQQLQLLQSQLQAAAARPSLMSNFPVHSNAAAQQLNMNNLVKQEPKQMYGGLTTGVPYRSAASNLPVPNAMIRTPDINTSPAPNRGNNLLSNFHSSQSTTHTPIDGPLKQELSSVRDKLDKVEKDHKQLEAQFTTVTKRKQLLIQMLQQRKEEMKREREEAEAILIMRANAEASKSKVPLIDSIAIENRQQAEKCRPPERLLPTTNFCHNLNAISNNYKRIAPLLIRSMTENKVRAQRKRDEYLAQYEEKYVAWSRRVEKSEKTPKKIAKDQKNRELFEKIFPEIKKEREEKERNERHERNSAGDEPVKSKEEKAAERACHVPLYCPRRPRHEFVNTNNDIDEQELKNVNDNISTFLSQWTQAERSVFHNKIRTYWKNFHVLSNFYWDKTARDMVKFFYSTKTEMKYKLSNSKAKKKVAKAYKPTPLPDFREMFDYLMSTCDLKSTFQTLSCLICSNDVHLFGSVLPRMRPEKERLRRKIAREQEYREKMPICNKCYSLYKKVTVKCPVGDCGIGRRRNKPSRALPAEFVELPVEEQSLIVRKLQFHPATTKICNNCYKKILFEIKCIRNGTFTMENAVQHQRSSENKKPLKWPFDRVDALFRAATDTDKNWELVSTQVSVDNFKPSARQCRLVHAKLTNYWQIKKRRVFLENSSRRLRRMYRRIKRATRIEHDKNQRYSVSSGNRALSKLSSQFAANTLSKHESHSSSSRPQQGSITQGIPVSRTPTTNTPLLANFIPTAPQSSTSSNMPPSMNQLGTHGLLKDKKWAEYLLEELGLAKDTSTDENAVEISQRVSQMSPYEFEMLSNRLKTRTQQDQEASALAKFKQMHRHQFEQQPREQELRFGEQTDKNQMRPNQLDNAHLANTPSAVQYSTAKPTTPDEALRQASNNSAERPNRKTGLANVMLESNNSGFRSRTNTLQKNIMNRPSSAFDSHQQAVKSESIDAPSDNDAVKMRQGRALSNSFTIQTSHCQTNNLNVGSTAVVASNAVDEPAYESLSDDDDATDSKARKTFDSASAQKSRWHRLYTIFNLDESERSHVPNSCAQHFQMPAIETLGISTPYEDLSD